MYISQSVSLTKNKYKQNLNPAALSKVLRLGGKPYDTLWCLYKAVWKSLSSCVKYVIRNFPAQYTYEHVTYYLHCQQKEIIPGPLHG